jgi:hypothetical protein
MTLTALAFAAGAAALQLQAELPSLAWLALLPACIAGIYFRPKLAAAFALGIGFLWAAVMAQVRVADWLSPELEGRDLDVVGVVSSLPAVGERAVRFEFEVESAEVRLPRKLLLAWHRSPWTEEGPALPRESVHPGERWLFTVRLRRPHGHVNPYGFDYEAWLLERGVGATGYVRQRGEQRRIGSRGNIFDWVEKARERVRDRFQAGLGATPAAGILAALAIGDQRAISAEECGSSTASCTYVADLAGWDDCSARRIPPLLPPGTPSRALTPHRARSTVTANNRHPMPIAQERIQAVRAYLEQAFPDWELADRWDGNHECHTFRLTRRQEDVHLLRVSRNVLDDNEPHTIAAILVGSGVAYALRHSAHHRLLLASHGLVELGPAP